MGRARRPLRERCRPSQRIRRFGLRLSSNNVRMRRERNKQLVCSAQMAENGGLQTRARHRCYQRKGRRESYRETDSEKTSTLLRNERFVSKRTIIQVENRSLVPETRVERRAVSGELYEKGYDE